MDNTVIRKGDTWVNNDNPSIKVVVNGKDSEEVRYTYSHDKTSSSLPEDLFRKFYHKEG